MKKLKFLIPVAVLAGVLLGLYFYFSTRPAVVGLCFRDCDDTATVSYRETLRDALKAKGYKVLIVDGNGNQAVQDQQVEKLLDTEVDLLIVEPVMVSAVGSIQEKAGDTPLLFIDREPEKLDKGIFVGGDPGQVSLLQGQMIQQLPNNGDVNEDGFVACLLIQGPEDSLDAIQFAQVAAGITGGKAIELQTVHGDWSGESGKTLCARALSTYGKDIEVVICAGDAMTVGVAEAIEEGGRAMGENIFLITAGMNEDLLKDLRSGAVTGTVMENTEEKIRVIVETAEKLLNGESVEKKNYVNLVAVTQEDAKRYKG